MMANGREQTTFRISESFAKQLQAYCEVNEETLSESVRKAAKRIVGRYRFNERLELIEKSR